VTLHDVKPPTKPPATEPIDNRRQPPVRSHRIATRLSRITQEVLEPSEKRCVALDRDGNAASRRGEHLLGALPPTLIFSMAAPAMQNHGMGKLLWRGHLPDGTTVVTGTDIAQIEEGRIHSLHVFLDAPKKS
jgi:hypothetical protein